MSFEECCQAILDNCPNGYAKAYAKAGLSMTDKKEIRVQCLYILNNITHWRGDLSKDVRASLKEIVAQ